MSKNKKNAPKRWKDTHPTKLKIRLLGNEIFLVYVSPDMTVEELKRLLELATGIPYDLQRLTYLDEAELVDTSTLKENEIVPGGAIELTVWHMWLDLVEKAIIGDIKEILEIGVSPNIPYSSPITEYMDAKTKMSWIKKRAFVVLCIAVHRENLTLCEEMIPYVENVNTRTPVGRTVLHIASSQGRCEAIKMLIEKGAKWIHKDHDGLQALDLAILFGCAKVERLLSMIIWKEKLNRKPVVKKSKESIKSSKPEDTETVVPELTPESQSTAPDIAVTTTTEDEAQRQNLSKTPTFPTMEVPVTTSPPSKKVAEQEEVKPKMDVEASADRMPQSKTDGYPPTGYNRNPDSFRKYLLSVKKQSRNFGYAASVIDDHLQRLDDVKYHTFQRKTLVSENGIMKDF